MDKSSTLTGITISGRNLAMGWLDVGRGGDRWSQYPNTIIRIYPNMIIHTETQRANETVVVVVVVVVVVHWYETLTAWNSWAGEQEGRKYAYFVNRVCLPSLCRDHWFPRRRGAHSALLSSNATPRYGLKWAAKQRARERERERERKRERERHTALSRDAHH